MNPIDYIQEKQRAWAVRNNIPLQGSEGSRGAKNYTTRERDNLFMPLSDEARAELGAGDGGELAHKGAAMPKFWALHSSSALGVNVFDYWKQNRHIPAVAQACGFCDQGDKHSERIIFEEKFPIVRGIPPNLDVVIHNNDRARYRAFAIECKFSEAWYGARGGRGLKSAYLAKTDLWPDIPNLRDYADRLCPEDEDNRYFHAAQMIKHILGLKRKYGKSGFRLLYLWYDCPGADGVARHAREVDSFMEIARRDQVAVHDMTYQELITRMRNSLGEAHRDYLDYLSGRYL